MVMVILHYPNLMPTLKELRDAKEKESKFFEKEIPGLIDKTWGINEKTGRGASVYHFEDWDTANAWFNSERQKKFREENQATIDYYDVGAVAYVRSLK